MVWASHDSQGNINGLSASQQGDLVELPDDDAAVIQFYEKAAASISMTTSVTPRQARLALLAAGLLDQVQAAVDATGGATKITWEYASAFDRNDPLITSIGASLNLTPSQIDALFASAAVL